MKPITTLLAAATAVYAVGVQYGYIKGWQAAVDEVERARRRGLRKVPKPVRPSTNIDRASY